MWVRGTIKGTLKHEIMSLVLGVHAALPCSNFSCCAALKHLSDAELAGDEVMGPGVFFIQVGRTA
jgi:hypothetical protein